MTKQNVVIASVPWTDSNAPIMAPAVLKSVLESHNISSVAIDLNAEVKNKIKDNPFRNEIISFFLTEKTSAVCVDEIYNLFDWMADKILSQNPDWVCLSLLTYLSQITNKWLCVHLKQRKPDLKIVIGGPGCFTTLKSMDTYALNLKKQKIIDYFISGDGEESLPQLLQGNEKYHGINASYWKEVENLDKLPVPNYEDYDWNLYKLKKVSIWGSRGCVQNCTFCDIHEHWNKFQWRSAESIFNEMMIQNQKYGINSFHFADSLVNGNQKEYRKLIKLLAEYNQDQTEDTKIKWSGFFIFREQDQMKEEDWLYTAKSGAAVLNVGVESFVEHIRYHVKKNFNNKDLEYGLEMCKKYSINVSLLLIVGYVTETQQDHEEQLNWIRSHKHFGNHPVISTHVGSGLAILPGTELHRTYKDLGIVLNSDQVYQDWTRSDINSTPEIRMHWHQKIMEELEKNGFNPTFGQDNHVLIEKYFEKK
jgi:hypothetical protein